MISGGSSSRIRSYTLRRHGGYHRVRVRNVVNLWHFSGSAAPVSRAELLPRGSFILKRHHVMVARATRR
ncbi:hypothetical protein KCP78_10540 [Salmonella enterica subsp. enterica]|nr:hypothetical protein KCP78_10540 [Salmonella enterica subsp. enterica]